jgi:hypothetical protein
MADVGAQKAANIDGRSIVEFFIVLASFALHSQ